MFIFGFAHARARDLRNACNVIMALLNYFQPISNDLFSLHQASKPVDTTTLGRKETKDVKKKSKRGKYNQLSQEKKAEIARYASEHGVLKAVRNFKEMNVKETSVRDWRNLYLLELKKNCKVAEPGERVIVKKLPAKDRGRPPLLGRKLDSFLKDRITSMRTRRAPIGTTVVIGVGRGILLKHDRRSLEEFGGHIKLGKECAKSVLHRMGFSKRRGNSKSKVTPDDLSILKENYLMDIKAVVEMEEIPEDMVVNWDQTAMKIVPSCTWTMEKRGTKRVEIKGVDDKRQITAVFACTVSGKFLPIQLIYQGTTTRCHPKGVMFPSDWHIKSLV